MSEKTSEDLVFDKLRTPSIQEMFAQQLYDRREIKDNIYFRLYFMKKFPNGDYEVKTSKVSEIQDICRNVRHHADI